jgi:hypothetical protein
VLYVLSFLSKTHCKAILPIRMDTQQHVRLDDITTLPNSLLQMVKITDRFLIRQVLQMAPEKKIHHHRLLRVHADWQNRLAVCLAQEGRHIGHVF